MDLYAFILGITLSITGMGAHAAMSKMDQLNQLVYQSPSLAQQQISELENQLSPSSPPIHAVRLQMLKCELLIQQGEYQAAIQLASLGRVNAKKHDLEQTVPYFNACEAEGQASTGDFKSAMPLLETGIAQAKQFKQPQALANLLRMRGQLDTDQENYLPAMEDLRLALDVAEQYHTQENSWTWPPHAYLLSAMGNLLYASGDLLQAVQYAYRALEQDDAKGKVRHILLLNAARMLRDAGDYSASENLLNEGKQLLPTLSTQLEQAYSYAIIASIEVEKGNFSKAEELAQQSLSTFVRFRQRLSIMQTNRLLADIKFEQGKAAEAVDYTLAAINTAQQMGQQGYLQQLYLTLSDYYENRGEAQLAYDNLQLAFQAAQLANKQLADIRFVQYKARLNREQSAEPTSVNESAILIPLGWMWVLVILGVILPATCLYLLIYRKQKVTTDFSISSRAPIHYQVLELAMNNAKRAQNPLTILLFGLSPTVADDLPTLEEKIKSKLREQDKLVYLSPESLMVILPGTSHTGAQQVMEQLIGRIQPWHKHAIISIGVASMQQFDTSTSLVKRAMASQVSRQKSNEVKLYQIGARG
ncbi:hypothetical protein L2750_21320 [Shewanella submarina]|uniref:GGDEF domain-containing protein n=1 Tax=Shewanella submarina TaxID=2016376 RepID=A0ABV7GLE1_9GAMM|nr:hypothetical protein [Shewanella submarina]MCL1039651.1 hypothetical protein [Shewanella submarina]